MYAFIDILFFLQTLPELKMDQWLINFSVRVNICPRCEKANIRSLMNLLPAPSLGLDEA